MIEERDYGIGDRNQDRSREDRLRADRESAEQGRSWSESSSDDNAHRDFGTGRDPDSDRHYRGYYSRSHQPFRTSRGYGDVYIESWTLTGPHTGRGPKGYRRSNEQILEEACRRLEQDGAIDASDIEVSCDDGIVRLQGEVDNRRAKRRAEDCVESVYGVRDVMNELTLRDSRNGNGNGSRERQASGRREARSAGATGDADEAGSRQAGSTRQAGKRERGSASKRSGTERSRY